MKKIIAPSAEKLIFGCHTKVTIPVCEYDGYIREQLAALFERVSVSAGKPCRSVTFSLGIPQDIRREVDSLAIEADEAKEAEKDDFVEGIDLPASEVKNESCEEEYVISFGQDTVVYATTPIGFLRALSTMMISVDADDVTEGILYDIPACAVRGYRVYLPGRETMDEFLSMLDFLVYYKYNTLILEIGGAMEYKRHPKINEKWVEFCADMNEYSGKAGVVQNSYHWAKNSIHSENGDGAYLSQEECRFIADECKKRGIEIIPECPTLSHTDYICLAYPELAERKEDPYPDTYCPSNPRSYEVVFDVLDEVIEVFRPKAINIGHDECYTLCLCDRCKEKDAPRVYADDIIKVKNYLEEKGVATYMWGEKLLKARYIDGHRIGGWHDWQNYNGVRFRCPWLFRCGDMLPKGITFLHWYWSFGEHLDDEYHAREFPVVFGNFNAITCQSFRTRIKRGVRGGVVSNWGSNASEYMQRNQQYYELVSTGHALWSDTYDTPQADMLHERTLRELYAKYAATVKNPLYVRHAAHHSVPYKRFWCGKFIEDEVYVLGHYHLTYDDGGTADLPVKLGTNIASRTATPVQIREASFRTLPVQEGEGYSFEHVYENPCPDKKITSVTYVPAEGKENIKVDYIFPTL